MSKSTRIRLEDARAVVRILGDASSQRLQPAAQQQAIIDGVCALLGGQTGYFIRLDEYGPDRPPVTRAVTPTSHVDAAVTAYSVQMRREFPTESDMIAGEAAPVMHDVQVPTLRRLAAVVGWRKYPAFKDVIDTAGVVDLLVPCVRFGEGNFSAVALSVHRRGDARAFEAREVILARFLAEELRHALVAGRLGDWGACDWDARDWDARDWDARDWGAPPARALTPRQQAVYALLLQGEAPKRIALHLGLSIHTVRDHVNAIYRRLGVSGRDELMARAVNARPAPAPPHGPAHEPPQPSPAPSCERSRRASASAPLENH